jgi:hypothetical protein
MKKLLTKITLHALLISMAMPCTSTMLATEPSEEALITYKVRGKSMHVFFDNTHYTIKAIEEKNLFNKEVPKIAATSMLIDIPLTILTILGPAVVGMLIGGFVLDKINGKAGQHNTGALRSVKLDKINGKVGQHNTGALIGFGGGLGLGGYFGTHIDDWYYKKTMHENFAKKQNEYFASLPKLK